jgi:NADH-quinone oxidoreductase subunit N
MLSGDIDVIRPEVYLALYCMGALLVGVYTLRDRLTNLLLWVTALVLVLMAWWIGARDGTDVAFGASFVDDGFARFAKVAILLAAATVLVLSQDYLRKANILRFEYPILVSLSRSA